MAKATKKINVADIAKLAKKIRKEGEKWTDAKPNSRWPTTQPLKARAWLGGCFGHDATPGSR